MGAIIWIEVVLALLYAFFFYQDLSHYGFHRNCAALLMVVLPLILSRKRAQRAKSYVTGTLARRRVLVRQPDEEDICPICHEFLLGSECRPLSYCRFGCGRAVHCDCMYAWLHHQARCVICDASWY